MKRSAINKNNILFRSASLLLLLTMLSLWLVIGLYAKYTVSASASNSARVADGLPAIELKEHEATLKDGIYELDENKEVTENKYQRVIPGVDISKDPFIRLNGTGEVDFVMYLRVTEKDFPTYTIGSGSEKAVTYDLTDNWLKVGTENGADVYQYVVDKNPFAFDAGTTYSDYVIKILKDDKLYVSEHYVGNDQTFTLTFEAWLIQAD